MGLGESANVMCERLLETPNVTGVDLFWRADVLNLLGFMAGLISDRQLTRMVGNPCDNVPFHVISLGFSCTGNLNS